MDGAGDRRLIFPFMLLEPLFSHTLFPVYFGLLTWLALGLREPRLGELFPVRRIG